MKPSIFLLVPTTCLFPPDCHPDSPISAPFSTAIDDGKTKTTAALGDNAMVQKAVENGGESAKQKAGEVIDGLKQ